MISIERLKNSTSNVVKRGCVAALNGRAAVDQLRQITIVLEFGMLLGRFRCDKCHLDMSIFNGHLSIIVARISRLTVELS